MGIYERDYMRRDLGGNRVFDPVKVGVRLFVALSAVVVVFTLCRVDKASESFSEAQSAKGSLRVNINTASEEELETIPQIGPSRAGQIVRHRPYSSVDDLYRKRALGEKMTNEIREFVKIDGATEKK
jgi:competence protein ComEA